MPERYNYCPVCGQENTNTQVSVKYLVTDFIHNYFSLDSRFGRSIKPFFIQPGALTRRFVEGQRTAYANPVRLYLLISLLHFFLFSLENDPSDTRSRGILLDNNETQNKSNYISISPEDSLSEDELLFLKGKQLFLIKNMNAAGASVDEVIDSLGISEKPAYQRYIIRQLVKIDQAQTSSLSEHILQNVPLLMFLLLPIYALLLNLFFRRQLYITHLIHSIHLHSFALMVFSIIWFWLWLGGGALWVFQIGFGVIMIYLIVSFKTTYQTRWFSAFWKFSLSSLLYLLVFGIAVVLEILISVLTF